MSVSPQPMTDQEAEIELVATVPLRVRSNNQIRPLISKAVHKAGLDDDWSLLFDPGMVDDLDGLLPAIGVKGAGSGNESANARAIIKESGQGNGTFSVSLVDDWLDALGYDPDEVREAATDDDRDPLAINVWAGHEMIAFEKPQGRRITIDPDEFEAEERPTPGRDDSGKFVEDDAA